jgi:hypothetical protein
MLMCPEKHVFKIRDKVSSIVLKNYKRKQGNEINRVTLKLINCNFLSTSDEFP